MEKIIHVLDINAPLHKIHQALNTEEGLSQWWTKQVFFENSAQGPIHFAFMGEFNPVMAVNFSNEKLSWKCIKGVPAWQNDIFEFTFSPHENGSTVQFTQNFSNDLNDEQKGRFNYIWGYYLQSLRLYCEQGQGNPFTLDN